MKKLKIMLDEGTFPLLGNIYDALELMKSDLNSLDIFVKRYFQMPDKLAGKSRWRNKIRLRICPEGIYEVDKDDEIDINITYFAFNFRINYTQDEDGEDEIEYLLNHLEDEMRRRGISIDDVIDALIRVKMIKSKEDLLKTFTPIRNEFEDYTVVSPNRNVTVYEIKESNLTFFEYAEIVDMIKRHILYTKDDEITLVLDMNTKTGYIIGRERYRKIDAINAIEEYNLEIIRKSIFLGEPAIEVILKK